MTEKPNEREVLTQFLELYQEYSCLWDTTSKEYSNRDLRNQALNILQEKLKLIDSDCTINAVKKKIENMRASYKRERKKALQSKQTGAGAEDVFVPTLWYYDLLSFLDQNDSINRSGIDTFSTADDDEMLTSEEIVEITPVKRRRLTIARKQDRLIDAAEKLLQTPDKPGEAYGLSTGQQLQEMSKTQRTIAEKLIAEVIFFGKLDKLTMDSNINLGHATNRIYVPSPSPSSSSGFFEDQSRSNSLQASTVLNQRQASNIVYVPSPSPSSSSGFFGDKSRSNSLQASTPLTHNDEEDDSDVDMVPFSSSKYSLEDYLIIKQY